MDRLRQDCWVWSPRRSVCLCPQHSGSFNVALINHREEEEEEEGATELCCSAGCENTTSHHSAHSGTSISSHLLVQSPGPSSALQLKTAMMDQEESEQIIDGCCCEGQRMETQGCVCGPKGPEGFGPCWSGSPYVYFGVRRNLVVGVEVVEEVEVEDTLEVITEDIYTDDLVDAELLFPT